MSQNPVKPNKEKERESQNGMGVGWKSFRASWQYFAGGR